MNPLGRIPFDWWQIPILTNSAKERLGYPTQKPLALLERIIQASSNPGDIILDPFCGCGTATAAAQKLGRRWIGVDITYLSIALQKNRLRDMFGLMPRVDYQVIGEPQDLYAARQLAQDDRYQFQWWALSLIQARPTGSVTGSRDGKKGTDRGIDGIITFVDEPTETVKRVIAQVKSGTPRPTELRDLHGTIEREHAPIGTYLTLNPPTREMKIEAVSAGYYHSEYWNKDYPKIQILTIQDLLGGGRVQMPPQWGTFQQAPRVREQGEQHRFDI